MPERKHVKKKIAKQQNSLAIALVVADTKKENEKMKKNHGKIDINFGFFVLVALLKRMKDKRPKKNKLFRTRTMSFVINFV